MAAVQHQGAEFAPDIRQAIQPTLLDRVIEWASPVRGLARMEARMRAAMSRAYLAASPSDTWRPRRAGASADADYAMDARRLRAKSRALFQNVEYIIGGLNARVAHGVGTGIVPKWGGDDGKRLAELWRQHAADTALDADGVRTVYAMQHTAWQTMDVDGECLVRVRRYRPAQRPGRVPLAFQLLEVDWVDDTRTSPQRAGNRVINGKEYTPQGELYGWWLWEEHPGNISTASARLKTRSEFVPASDIRHVYQPARPGQGRGFPRLAGVINRSRDLQLLEDGELQRKLLEGRLSVLASGNIGGLQDPQSALAGMSKTGQVGQLASGGIVQTAPGMDFTVVQPRAVPGFVDYCYYNIHLICAGGGFLFEHATTNMKEVNFSSSRMARINFKQEIEQLQWLHFIPGLCEWMAREFAEAAALAGLVNPSLVARYTLEHSTPKWESVNPVQDAAADQAQIGFGLSSWSERYRRNNDDPEVRIQELAGDIAKFKELGVWTEILALTKGGVAIEAALAEQVVKGEGG